VAHELLIDLAEFDKAAGLKVIDFAKRLQVGYLVPGTNPELTSCVGLWLPSPNMFLAHSNLHVD
jgi:hypothetical protein